MTKVGGKASSFFLKNENRKIVKSNLLLVVFFISVILILSVNIVSASLLGDIGKWFNNIIGNNEKNNLQGDLGSVNPMGNSIDRRLIAYYPFEGNASDMSGNGNDGVVNGATLTTGVIGQAYSFDGTDYINIGNPSGLSSSTGYSISIWLKRSEIATSSNRGMRLFEKSNNMNDGYLMLTESDGTITGYFGNGATLGFASFGIVNNVNQWYHLVITTNLTHITTYTNGVKINTQPLNGFLSSMRDLRIGSDSFGYASTFFNGAIDEVKIWNYALSPDEVNAEYQRGNNCVPVTCSQLGKTCGTWDNGCGTQLNCGTSCPAGQSCSDGVCVNNNAKQLVAYFAFEGNANDLSGNGNNGVNNGATFTNGKIGQGINLSGNNYIDAGHNSNLTLSAFSASVWFKFNQDNPPYIYTTLLSKGGSGSGYEVNYMIFIYNSSNGNRVSARVGAGNSENYFSSNVNVNVNDGKWHNAVLIYDSATGKGDLYLDNISQNPQTGLPPAYMNINHILAIGVWKISPGGGYGYFKGAIDEVKIWNYALSPDEINTEYQRVGQNIEEKLVAYYAFEGNANDLSGNNNNGINNGATFVNGKVGQAASFNGVNNYISVAKASSSSLDFSNTQPFSVSLWFYPKDTKNSFILLNNAQFGFTWAGINSPISFYNGNYFSGNKNSWTQNSWNHVIGIDNGNNYCSIYVNGVLDKSGPCTPNRLVGYNFNIGGYPGFNYFNGLIDEVKIWNYVLGPSEIQQEYQRGNNCVPMTCSQLGKNCGSWDNGCGTQLNCGTSCPLGQSCSDGVCISNNNLCLNKNCNDNNLCTVDSCNPSNGVCINTPITCPLGQSCDIATGNCVNNPASNISGYIVEFVDTPIIVKGKEIENKSNVRVETVISQNFVNPSNSVNLSIEKIKRDAQTELDNYKNNLTNNKEKIINDIENKLENKNSNALSSVIDFIIRSITGNSNADNTDLNISAEWTGVFNGVLLNINSSDAEKIKSIPGVKSVSPNLKIYVNMMDSVPLIGADKVWQLDRDGNNCVRSGKECLTGKNVIIGIIDTGIDYTHPDLGGCLGQGCKVIGGYDFANNDYDPIDDLGHGTHVTGIAAANGKIKGVAPDVKLYSYKVFNSRGEGYTTDVIFAINNATDPNQDGNTNDHLDIISLSLGVGGNPDSPISQSIDNAVSVGVIAIAAAGNSGPTAETVQCPGCARKAITVGATDKSDKIASFSSRGPVNWISSMGIQQTLNKPDIVAPGVSIYSTYLNNGYTIISGTSMATPMVSGAAALIKQAHPDWSPENIKLLLQKTSINLGYNANIQGTGRLNIIGGLLNIKTNTIGLYNPSISRFYLRNSNTVGVADTTFLYGSPNAGWLPIAGDWDNDGRDTMGLYDPVNSKFYLRNTNNGGYANTAFLYGAPNAGWLPIAGDWDNDGKTTIGLYDPKTSKFYLRNTNTQGNADITFGYGLGGSQIPIAGDWDGDGRDTIGLYDPVNSKFFLRNSNAGGNADITFMYGVAGAGWKPVIGGW